VANNEIYCGKLCAALGLIAEVHAENEITRDNIDIWAEGLMANICWNNACYEDKREDIAVPLLVRWSDANDALNDDDLQESAPEGTFYVVVPIDDEGTPDWIPPGGKQLTVSDDEIDRVVDDLLRNGDVSEGRL
jgi:hypothetical protein